MRRLGVIVAVAVGLTLPGGCGGDDAGEDSLPDTVAPYVPTDGPSLEQWQAETTAVCEVYEPRQDAVVAEHPPSNDPADVIAFVDALTPVAEKYLGALNEIEVPPERRRDVERTYDLYQLNFEAAARLREAGTQGDAPGMQSAARALEAQARELIELLTDLGVPACV